MPKPTFAIHLDRDRTEIVRRENVAGIRVESMAEIVRRVRKSEEAVDAALAEVSAANQFAERELDAKGAELREAREVARTAKDDAEKSAAARRAGELDRELKALTEKPHPAVAAARLKRDAAQNASATLRNETIRAGSLICGVVLMFKAGGESVMILDESHRERVLMQLAAELPHLFAPAITPA